MSSAYKGYYINGSKESGYLAMDQETPERFENGKKYPTIAALKRAVDAAKKETQKSG
jgi:hypothetical protein